jgi:MraZ protein
LDGVSRLLIPATLREYANFSKKIIMSGQGHNFELWDEDAWHKQLDSLDALSKQESVPEAVSQLSL